MAKKETRTAGIALIDPYSGNRTDPKGGLGEMLPGYVGTKKPGIVPYFVSSLGGDPVLGNPDNFTICGPPNRGNTYSVLIDIMVHVGLWIAAFVFEFMVWDLADKAKKPPTNDLRTYPFVLASFVCYTVSFGIVLLSTLFHWMTGFGIEPKTYFPFLTAFMEGGINASILLTMVAVLFTVGVAGATDEWRDKTITLIILKCYIAKFLVANVRRAVNGV